MEESISENSQSLRVRRWIGVGKLRTAAVPGAQMQLMRSAERLKRQPGQETLSFMHQIKGFGLGFMASIAQDSNWV